MIAQRIDIPQYDWRIEILHVVRPRDTDYIIDRLCDMGCAQRHLKRAYDLLRRGKPNQGLTYSDKRAGHTLIAICRADNIGQYINTLVHELDHLTDHISQCYGIPYDSEENSYLLGDVAEAVYDDAITYAIRRLYGYMN